MYDMYSDETKWIIQGEALRGTGRSLSIMLNVIANAIEVSGLWHPFVDHEGVAATISEGSSWKEEIEYKLELHGLSQFCTVELEHGLPRILRYSNAISGFSGLLPISMRAVASAIYRPGMWHLATIDGDYGKHLEEKNRLELAQQMRRIIALENLPLMEVASVCGEAAVRSDICRYRFLGVDTIDASPPDTQPSPSGIES